MFSLIVSFLSLLPFLSLLSLLPNLAAAGQVVVKNHCAEPLYAWAVGAVHVHDDERIIIGPSAVQYIPLANIGGTGVSLKVKGVPYYEHGGKDLVQVEWAVTGSGDTFIYDLSNVDCKYVEGGCPFIGNGVLLSSGPSCKAIFCNGQACKDAYQGWDPEPTHDSPNYPCSIAENLVFETCVGDPASGGPPPSGNNSGFGKPEEPHGEGGGHDDGPFEVPETGYGGKGDKDPHTVPAWPYQPSAPSVPPVPSVPSVPSAPSAPSAPSVPSAYPGEELASPSAYPDESFGPGPAFGHEEEGSPSDSIWRSKRHLTHPRPHGVAKFPDGTEMTPQEFNCDAHQLPYPASYKGPRRVGASKCPGVGGPTEGRRMWKRM